MNKKKITSVFHVCVSSLGVSVLERIVSLIFLWSDFELQKSLQKIVFIKNSLYLHYLCKSFKFQFVTFYWTIYELIDLSMSDFFFGFLLFFFVHYFNYLIDLYFYIFILLLKWRNFNLVFLILTIVDLSMNEWFHFTNCKGNC